YLVFKERVACPASDFLLPSSSLLPRRLFSARRGVSFYFSSASSVKLLFSPSCWLPESSAPPSGFR
ncbi:hypothetical protein, partial [Myxococcus sp. CA005]|uniref:hypothetical protein n=1 Tax=Myxococcus sp. CA005 TaxID=2562800 RepID=UPI001E2AF110